MPAFFFVASTRLAYAVSGLTQIAGSSASADPPSSLSSSGYAGTPGPTCCGAPAGPPSASPSVGSPAGGTSPPGCDR